MNIFVNHQNFYYAYPRISFEEVCNLAQVSPWASVMYVGKRNGDSQRSGILTKGQDVAVEEGMHFSAHVTNNA